jgi:hypothetical protein
MSYRLHYRSQTQPAPYKVSNVVCPDGEIRETHRIWCWEGHTTRAAIFVNRCSIDGQIVFTRQGINLLAFRNTIDEARFIPDQEEEFWNAVRTSSRT